MRIGEKYDFRAKNFCGLLTFAVPKETTPQILRRKLSCIATKPWCFPLYGITSKLHNFCHLVIIFLRTCLCVKSLTWLHYKLIPRYQKCAHASRYHAALYGGKTSILPICSKSVFWWGKFSAIQVILKSRERSVCLQVHVRVAGTPVPTRIYHTPGHTQFNLYTTLHVYWKLKAVYKNVASGCLESC